MTEEEIDKLWDEMGIDIFHKVLPKPIEWHYLCWNYIRETWEDGEVKSNSYRLVKKFVKHKFSCSDLYIYPNTKRGREACSLSAWD